MTKQLVVLLFLFSACSLASPAQEMLRNLEINPLKSSVPEETTKDQKAVTLTLPFREDFSYAGPFPDQKLWADQFVYINQGFAIHPKTLGTATFDALNNRGRIYPEAQNNSYQFSADFLTTHPIRLDSVFSPLPMALSPADSIMLTFYYQPQGRGSAPRQRDSLVVEFLHTPAHYAQDPDNPGSTIFHEDLWVSVWRAEGQSLESFLKDNNNVHFKPVTIVINDPVYLRKDFRFRFRNYNSFPLTKTPDNFGGNTGIWNIDYILLDYGRTRNDRYYYDMAFAAPAQSALRDLQSMPWSHYIRNPQQRNRTSFNTSITNLDNTTFNYIYRYFVTDENNNIVRNYSGGTWNIGPFSRFGYQSYVPHANPPLAANFFGTLTPAKARKFTIFHVVTEGTDGDEWPRNDTIVFNQIFDNYFAYDGGIPDNGYGLVGFNARGAVRFVLGHTDTLTDLQFYFNPTLNNRNHKPFLITIWKNLAPEEIIYQSSPVFVQHEALRHQFVSYQLSEPLQVSDTIYVGWQQISNDFLHIGFDSSNDASAHVFYNTHGEWLPTLFKGSLMIRPVFGEQIFAGLPEASKQQNTPLIYPNPARGNTLQISLPNQTRPGDVIRIYSISGAMTLETSFRNEIDVSELANGMYFLRVHSTNGEATEPSKFIIAR